MKPACPECGQVHHPIMARAVGRFDPKAEPGYRANYLNSPLRPTRDEAENDMCQWLQNRRTA